MIGAAKETVARKLSSRIALIGREEVITKEDNATGIIHLLEKQRL